MDLQIIVAAIAGISTVIVAVVAAYASVRQANRKELSDIRASIGKVSQQVSVNEVKVNTLWEIYAEDAIRSAQKGGLVAARSAVRPTEKLKLIMSEELQADIQEETAALSTYISSPYDIAIEIWMKHRKELLYCSKKADIPAKASWGGLVTIVYNVLYDNGKVSMAEVPVAMTE